MACLVCGAGGPRFCVPCRRKHGGKTLAVSTSAASPRRRRRAKARRPRAARPSASPRRRPRRKHLSRLAFLRKMRAGKLAAAKRRARGGK